MNHYGNSETVWKVFMSVGLTLNNIDSLIPGGIKIKPNLSKGTAWDDFDINLETPLGADRIHNT